MLLPVFPPLSPSCTLSQLMVPAEHPGSPPATSQSLAKVFKFYFLNVFFLIAQILTVYPLKLILYTTYPIKLNF